MSKDRKSSLRVGKNSFELWKLPQKIDEADSKLVNLKKLFKEKNIKFNASKEYDKYLSQVKNNVDNFAALFSTE